MGGKDRSMLITRWVKRRERAKEPFLLKRGGRRRGGSVRVRKELQVDKGQKNVHTRETVLGLSKEVRRGPPGLRASLSCGEDGAVL